MENTRKRATFNLKNLLVPLLPCLFFFIQYLVVPVTGDVQVTPFTPRENITIDCGSSTGGLSPDGRAWIGDVDGKFSPIEQNKSSAVSVESQPPSSVDIPYSTARISYSEFTYSIPLTAAGPFTLVRNFNAFLHIRGQGNSPPTSAKPDKSTSKIIVVVVATISGIVTVSLLLVLGSELNGNDENHANNSSNIDYHVLYTSGSGSMRVGR
ncbi:hypothetical protein V6N13_127955 [Hibiscus sabdariffa]